MAQLRLSEAQSDEMMAWDDESSDFRDRGSGRRQGALRGGSLRQLGGVGMLLRNAEEYNLTEEQEDKLHEMQTKFELEKVDLLAELHKAKIVFRALAREQDSAEQDVMRAIDKVADCEANLRKMRYRHLKEAQSVLDDDQRRNLKSFYRKRMREKFKSLRVERLGLSR